MMRRLFVLLSAFLLACDDTTAPDRTDSAVLGAAITEDFDVRPLLAEELWYRHDTYKLPRKPQDAAGVPLYEWRDGTRHYHPVMIAQQALQALSNYRISRNPVHIQEAATMVDALVERATRHEGGLYFPYTFAFPLHGRAVHTMPVPWYSAMAQGQILSLIVRLADQTGDSRWAPLADSVFQSMVQVDAPEELRVAGIDELGYFWLEEYPFPGMPDLTLNGFLFAIYGLYEYDQMVGTAEARAALLAALTTAKRYGPSYREPGGISAYCLAHRDQLPGYHDLHVEQFYDLYRITGAEVFRGLSATLQADTP